MSRFGVSFGSVKTIVSRSVAFEGFFVAILGRVFAFKTAMELMSRFRRRLRLIIIKDQEGGTETLSTLEGLIDEETRLRPCDPNKTLMGVPVQYTCSPDR